MPGIETLPPERTERRSGVSLPPKLLPEYFSNFPTAFFISSSRSSGSCA